MVPISPATNPPPEHIMGGGGGWNAIRYQILDPPKNQISDPPPPKIKYEILHLLKKIYIRYLTTPKISDITPSKKIRYQISDSQKSNITPPKKNQN